MKFVSYNTFRDSIHLYVDHNPSNSYTVLDDHKKDALLGILVQFPKLSYVIGTRYEGAATLRFITPTTDTRDDITNKMFERGFLYNHILHSSHIMDIHSFTNLKEDSLDIFLSDTGLLL